MACQEALRCAWERYLTDNALETSSCPIAGLF